MNPKGLKVTYSATEVYKCSMNTPRSPTKLLPKLNANLPLGFVLIAGLGTYGVDDGVSFTIYLGMQLALPPLMCPDLAESMGRRGVVKTLDVVGNRVSDRIKMIRALV